jgi:hypothetical protein
MIRELSVQEQKYQAVMAVLADGASVSEVAQRWGVSRQSVHAWLRRYEDEGLAGLERRSSRPGSCPHQMSGVVEAGILEMRSAGVRWNRSTFPVVVGDGLAAAMRTYGVEDHSRFCVSAAAQAELDEWVSDYNHQRPHSSIGMVPPAARFENRPMPPRPARDPVTPQDRSGNDWVARRAGANGVISVSWQQICLGKAAAGRNVDVHLTDRVIQVWDGNQLLKTAPRTTTGEVRKKRASVARTED